MTEYNNANASLRSVEEYNAWRLKDAAALHYPEHVVCTVSETEPQYPIIGYLKWEDGLQVPAAWNINGECVLYGKYHRHTGHDLIDPWPEVEKAVEAVWNIVGLPYRYLSYSPSHGWRMFKQMPKLVGGSWYLNSENAWGYSVGSLKVLQDAPKGLPIKPMIWKRPEE